MITLKPGMRVRTANSFYTGIVLTVYKKTVAVKVGYYVKSFRKRELTVLPPQYSPDRKEFEEHLIIVQNDDGTSRTFVIPTDIPAQRRVHPNQKVILFHYNGHSNTYKRKHKRR